MNKMNKRFFITIIFMSSLAYGRGIADLIREVAKTGEVKPVIEVLKNADIDDKRKALIFASEIGISDNDVLIIASSIGVPDIVRLLLNKGANPNAKDNLNYAALDEAIVNARPEIVNILLSDSRTIVDKSDLELAKANFIKLEKDIKKMKELGSDTGTFETRKNKIAQIGRILIAHLGLYTGQSGISRQGITGVLPAELAAFIATFMHSEKSDDGVAVNKD